MNGLVWTGLLGAGLAMVAAASRSAEPEPRRGRVGRHWSWDELTVSAKARQLGLDNTPLPHVRRNLAWMVHHVLDPLRARYGREAVRVNSGYRSPAVNRAVGGAPRSLHQVGLAFDLAGTAMRRPEVLTSLRAAGLRVLTYPRHVHIELRTRRGRARIPSLYPFNTT